MKSNTAKTKQTVTVFGLGKMGAQIARRLTKKGIKVCAWNRSEEPVKEAKKSKVFATTSIEEVMDKSKIERSIYWIMLPHNIVDEFIFGESGIGKYLKKGDIVIDGGNSFYKDTIRRGAELKKKGIYFFDSGTSGGVWGEKNGFALMVGGPKKKWAEVESIFKALSSGDNYAYLGESGSGHFTKMVHNGIEYGMMEAIGEGYAVLDAGPFKLNMKDVTRVYQTGSVVRSWLIDLCRNIFETENIKKTNGFINATGEGEWTINAGKELGVDVRVIEDALNVRKESSDPKYQGKFSNKIVSLLRKQFGGHGVVTEKSKIKKQKSK